MAIALEAGNSPSSAVTAIQVAPHAGQAAGEDKGSRAAPSESGFAAAPDWAVRVNEKMSLRCSISIETRWVRFMLKQMSNLQFGEFTLDRYTRELRRQGTVLPVSGKAFDLLSYMVANAGRPLSKSELLDAVWPGIIVEESNLSQNVFLLRKVLGGGSEGPIKTFAGRGYQFVAEPKRPAPNPPTTGGLKTPNR